jgi:hypothetical protein
MKNFGEFANTWEPIDMPETLWHSEIGKAIGRCWSGRTKDGL